MQISILLLCIICGYLIGSISFPRLIMRIAAPEKDLENVSLKNYSSGGTFHLRTVGATTASVILGPKIGGLLGIIDILKGFLPTLIIRLLLPEFPYYIFIGASIVVGHIWPIYYRFRGGGGLSPALGTFLVLDPIGIIISVVIAFIVGLIIKQLEVMTLGGPILFILWIIILTGNVLFIVFTIFINLIMIIAIIPDIRVNLKARRDGTMDMSTAMEEIPMGKMIKKMMDKLGLSSGQGKPK